MEKYNPLLQEITKATVGTAVDMCEASIGMFMNRYRNNKDFLYYLSKFAGAYLWMYPIAAGLKAFSNELPIDEAVINIVRSYAIFPAAIGYGFQWVFNEPIRKSMTDRISNIKREVNFVRFLSKI